MADCSTTWIIVILCLVGLLKEFRPSESYLIEYAVDHQNFTAPQMLHDVLPVTTYGYIVWMILLVLTTDVVRYKPVIVLGMVSYVMTWSITIFLYETPLQAQVRQLFHSLAASSELAYFTYMYANVDKSRYKQVTSYTHSALHVGRFLAGLTAQVTLSLEFLTLEKLNYVTLLGVTLALLLSLFLPKVKRAIYFYPRHSVISVTEKEGRQIRMNSICTIDGAMTFRQFSISDENNPANNTIRITRRHVSFKKRIKRALPVLKEDFKVAYTNRYVLKWSLWWAIAFAVHLQVKLYAENLWKQIELETEILEMNDLHHKELHHDKSTGFNGAVEATEALLSAILAIGVGIVKTPWSKFGEWYLTVISFIEGAVLVYMSQTQDVNVAYACYIAFQTVFQVVIIIAAAEVAIGVKDDSEAFIFGINTMVALIIQGILTYAITGEHGFELGIRSEFVVYGIYSILLGIFFLIIGVQNRRRIWKVDNEDTSEEVYEQKF